MNVGEARAALGAPHAGMRTHAVERESALIPGYGERDETHAENPFASLYHRVWR